MRSSVNVAPVSPQISHSHRAGGKKDTATAIMSFNDVAKNRNSMLRDSGVFSQLHGTAKKDFLITIVENDANMTTNGLM